MGNELYREEYTYEEVVDSLYDVATKTIKGDTASSDYTSKQYVDKYGNVVKEVEILNNNGEEEEITTEYTYDYIGNTILVRNFLDSLHFLKT